MGTPGSGKSTLGKDLAKHFNFKHYSGGDMRRAMAKDKGITLAQLNKIGETEDWTDVRVDKEIELIGKKQNDFVIDSRLAWHFIPDSIKIFLDANEHLRAKRMLKRTVVGESFTTVEEAMESNKKRIESDIKRYKKYYDLDPFDKSNYDLVLDSTGKDHSETLKEVLDYLKDHKV